MRKNICGLRHWWDKNGPIEISSILVLIIFLSASIYIYRIPIVNETKEAYAQLILTFIFYTIQTASTLLAAYNIARVSLENTRSKDYKKKEYSFDFVRSWDSPNFLNARNFSRKIKKDLYKKDDDIVSEIKYNPELRSAVILLFNFADNAKLGLENGILDPNIIKNLAPTLIAILKKYEIYMHNEEWLQKDNPEIYKEDFDATIKILNETISTNS